MRSMLTQHDVWTMRKHDVMESLRLVPLRLRPWLRFLANRHAYRYVDVGELRSRRRSETVFVFGSGASLNELAAEDWEEIARHDTFGFNWFVHQRYVRCDFHLIRGVPDTDRDPMVWQPQLEEYFNLIRTNPCFSQTAFLVHGGFRAINGNRAIGYRLLPPGSTVFRWRTNMGDELPSRSFQQGLVHGYSTLQECINAAYLLGWTRIVLAGVDLYDRRYFWLGAEETRSIDVRREAVSRDSHARSQTGMIEALGDWSRWLAGEGVELSVLNARSLLARVLSVASTPDKTPPDRNRVWPR
jgi:hypothetical protein